jgi:hypothetical protein
MSAERVADTHRDCVGSGCSRGEANPVEAGVHDRSVPQAQRFAILAVLAALVIGQPAAVRAQCAMCRTLLSTPEGQQLVAGLRSGILLLLAAPFVVFATVAVLAIRSQRALSAARVDADGAS